MTGWTEILILLASLCMALYVAQIVVFTTGLARSQLLSEPEMLKDQFVSIIIPVRNEEQNITDLLEEIVNQDYPYRAMEVIMVDDHSSDGTMALVRKFAEDHPFFPLIAVESGDDHYPHGKKGAIRRAVDVAEGEIFLLTDADTRRTPRWIIAMVAPFKSPGVQMVLGPVCFTGEQNLLQEFQSLEFLGLMGTTAGSASLGIPVMCNGANLAYRRQAFELSGGFNTGQKFLSGDDQFLMSSVKRRFGRRAILFNNNTVASVVTLPEKSLAGFIQQRMRWVSKSKGYRDPVVIAVGLITWLTHLVLLTGAVAGIFYPALLPVILLLFAVKTAIDYPMVRRMSLFFGKEEHLKYYLPAQLFQLIYVPVTGIAGLVIPYHWKGRKG